MKDDVDSPLINILHGNPHTNVESVLVPEWTVVGQAFLWHADYIASQRIISTIVLRTQRLFEVNFLGYRLPILSY
jgi:hypothetical protein